MPGSGKTWLSQRLAKELGYALWSRDALKEAMYDALPKPVDVDDLSWSREIGAAAFAVFLRLAPALGPRLILDAHFQARFGGHDDVRALDPRATQIFLHASLDVILQRAHDRRPAQHPSHQVYPLPSMADIEGAASVFRPLDVDGPLLEIDTSSPVDVDEVAAWVRQQSFPTPRP